MSIATVLSPVFALVALLFFTLLRTAATRVGALKKGEVAMGAIALGQSAWPTPVQQVSNAYQNQTQLPLVFNALVAFAILTKKDDFLFVIMSWLFVATRYGHAFVHITSNNVPVRFYWFAAGFAVLMLMWIVFAARILFAL